MIYLRSEVEQPSLHHLRRSDWQSSCWSAASSLKPEYRFRKIHKIPIARKSNIPFYNLNISVLYPIKIFSLTSFFSSSDKSVLDKRNSL